MYFGNYERDLLQLNWTVLPHLHTIYSSTNKQFTNKNNKQNDKKCHLNIQK